MFFKFPNEKEGVLVSIRFPMPLFHKIKQIAEDEDCLRSEVIMVLLETAVESYLAEKKRESTAYPTSGEEYNPDEENTTKNTPPKRVKEFPFFKK